MALRLRPYQQDCFNRNVTALRSYGRVVSVLPTGVGKTVIFCALAEVARKRVLVVTEGRGLVEQTTRQMRKLTTKTVAVEMADQRSQERGLFRPDIVVCSVDSLSPDRLTRFDPDDFGLIIPDEAHHATGASYLRVFDHFKRSKVAGFTATPDRTDGVSLKSAGFEHVAYEMQLHDAIAEGWLCFIDIAPLDVDAVDLSSVKRVTSKNGIDYHKDQLESQMMSEKALHQIAEPTVREARGRPTIVFCPSIPHAERMAIVLNDYDPEGKAVCVSHETTKSRRKRLMDQIKSGDSLYLCNVNIATEGYDHPPTAVIVNAAPTTSRLRLAQRAGRATRTLDGVIDPFAFGTAQQRLEAIAASAKPICTFLDFTDASNDHDLAHPSEILAGHELTPEERAAMQGMLRSGRASKMADLDSMLCRAKIEAEAERLRKEDERQRLLITCEVNYRRKPLQRNKELTRNGLVRKPPNLATPKIKARLKQQGLHVESMTEDQVVAAWKDFQHRRFAKKPSMGQEKLLKELNLWHGSISRFEATRLLDQHFKNFKTNRRGNLNARAY